ncbi:MAG: hypothetical protein R3185_04425, partial [Candidatus Thermoplasmatota archaeon]|nr:hypothetical protein [Candidatus Thermoplasmatota archaeon]
MMQNRSQLLDGWALAILAATAILVAPLATLPTIADAQPASTLACPEGYAENPIWISEIEIQMVRQENPDSIITPDGAVFVGEGDQLRVAVTVADRASQDGCRQLLRTEGSLGENPLQDVEPFLTYEAGDVLDESFGDGDCALPPAGTCTFESARFTVDENPQIQDGGGEQRIRVVAKDDNEPLAGAERIIVVNHRPNLEISQFSWESPNPSDRVTTSSSVETLFEISVINTGTYPTWNPNGGEDLWGRSAFDPEGDGDEAPDERNPNAPGYEQTYFNDADPLPPCRLDAGQTPGWTSDALCNYKRGMPMDLTLAWELSRTGSVVSEGEAISSRAQPSWDKDTAVPAQANAGGAPLIVDTENELEEPEKHNLTITFNMPGFDMQDKAGTYSLAWTANPAGEIPEES